jgi:hypothetical protein
MTMHLAQGLTTTRTTKRKKKPITETQMKKYETMWRQHNKDMRRKHLHDFQFAKLEDFVKYMRGEWKPKRNTSTVMNTPWHSSGPTVIRDTKHIPSLKTEASFSPCTKKEPMQYTGERKLLGIATMHKSNMVPIFEDDNGNGKKQATEIAQMRRN